MNLTSTFSTEFHLFLFSNDQATVRKAIAAGVDGIIVDWENQGKKARQESFDTQINYDTYDDLCRVREVTPAGKLICRINGFSPGHTQNEIELALKAGADEIFLPMVENCEEAQQTFDMIAGRAEFSILIETVAALGCLDELSQLSLKRAYIGLNDLHIQQNSRNIFMPLMNGTVKTIRGQFDIPLGAGGVTYPPNGKPIASKYLINEYARLGINFSFLRRTFLRDHENHSMDYMVQTIKKAYADARLRSPDEAENDFRVFRDQVESWTTNPYHV
ncbi:aldolase/citrate lyase family protein [Dyadobacter pollutisoli]|uniref:Aldolase/citrate lyase family protein n=1 Tax=Dyadobacter pollutisoli TaxID=2910158 RepID=A0A9E8NA46_9BACT|nr:aldolase/citrate lyase family protein [Dyadobacter pollutisoli]WAC12725.1 aldolase/citrate lyase family protein [Dyadobacter pollutisoli]